VVEGEYECERRPIDVEFEQLHRGIAAVLADLATVDCLRIVKDRPDVAHETHLVFVGDVKVSRVPASKLSSGFGEMVSVAARTPRAPAEASAPSERMKSRIGTEPCSARSRT